MKKLLAIVLAAVMVLSLAACGGGGGGTTTGKIPHDQITHVLEGKEETTYHDFVDGKCTRCAETTIFRQEPMYKSPEILFTEQAQQGTIEYFWYPTEAYCVERKYAQKTGDESFQGKLHIMKRAFIYLPYGYDPNRAEPYNVMFMMHGNKLNEGYWFANGFYKPTDSNFTNGYGTDNMLDYMYMNEDIEDTLFVAMTMYEYYGGTQHEDWVQGPGKAEDSVAVYTGNDTEQDNAYSGFIDPNYPVCEDFPWYMKKGQDYEGVDTYWWMEFQYGLYPFVIEHYNVYAKEATDEAMKAARDHVGISGLSRGGSSVNCVALNCLEYVSWFAYQSTGQPGTAQQENFKAKANEYPVNYVFVSSGSEEGPVGGDAGMLKVRDNMGWSEGSDLAGGDKICYITVNGTAHNYATWITNLWNQNLIFFKK